MKKTDNIFHKQVYKALRQNEPELAQEFKLRYYKPPKKKIHYWPLKHKWWQDRKFDPVREMFQFLEPLLIEIGDKRYRLKYNEVYDLIFPDSFDDAKSEAFSKKHGFYKNDKPYFPAFMKPGCKKGIALRAGCSVSSTTNYLGALVRIGAMRVNNLGKGRIYYSAGYWAEWKIEKDKYGKKVVPYLNQKMAMKLLDPNEFYLRKKKKNLRL